MTITARLFRNGRSQAVRLPLEYRFQGSEVRIRRVGNGVLLEPITRDVQSWFKELDAFQTQPFMTDGRKQPAMPVRKVF